MASITLQGVWVHDGGDLARHYAYDRLIGTNVIEDQASDGTATWTASGGDEAGTAFVESLIGKRVMVRDELGNLRWGTLAIVERAADVEEVVRITVALEGPPTF